MLKRILLIVLSLILLVFPFTSCSSAEEEKNANLAFYRGSPVRGAHVAKNTSPLETDKFLDAPDFILYTKDTTTVQLSPEQQTQVYAEFEAIMTTVEFASYQILGPIFISETVAKMHSGGAVRFCYQQRRYYTGIPGNRTDPSEYYYFSWGHLMFDEVIISDTYILFGLDGYYKSVGMYGDYVTFYRGKERREIEEISFLPLNVIAEQALP